MFGSFWYNNSILFFCQLDEKEDNVVIWNLSSPILFALSRCCVLNFEHPYITPVCKVSFNPCNDCCDIEVVRMMAGSSYALMLVECCGSIRWPDQYQVIMEHSKVGLVSSALSLSFSLFLAVCFTSRFGDELYIGFSLAVHWLWLKAQVCACVCMTIVCTSHVIYSFHWCRALLIQQSICYHWIPSNAHPWHCISSCIICCTKNCRHMCCGDVTIKVQKSYKFGMSNCNWIILAMFFNHFNYGMS